MSIERHPLAGTILICDFDQGFKVPEMVKRRPVVVVSPPMSSRPGLCTVVGLSTTAPEPKRAYHCKITLDPPLPRPWSSEMWVKSDMINAVAFHRLNLIRTGKDDRSGRRLYRMQPLTDTQMSAVRACVLHALGLFKLTKQL